MPDYPFSPPRPILFVDDDEELNKDIICSIWSLLNKILQMKNHFNVIVVYQNDQVILGIWICENTSIIKPFFNSGLKNIQYLYLLNL